MPSVPRPGVKGVYVELPERLVQLLHERAAAEERNVKTLILQAIRAHLGVQPQDYEPPAAEPAPEPAPRGKGARGKRRKPRGDS